MAQQGSMDAKAFASELRRRNVHKVAVVYAVLAWLVLEIASISLSELEAPGGLLTALIVILVIGFALALYISWSFEATPDGLKRTENIAPTEVLPTWSKTKFVAFVSAVALLAAGLLMFDLLRHKSEPPPPAAGPDLTEGH